MRFIPFRVRIFVGIVIAMMLLAGICQGEVVWDSFSNEQVVNAIFFAEGGEKATYAYGIRSIPYKDKADARQICLNSVRNGRRRWLNAGKPSDLIVYIGNRYCPPSSHPYNKYWVNNVKRFLIREAV